VRPWRQASGASSREERTVPSPRGLCHQNNYNQVRTALCLSLEEKETTYAKKQLSQPPLRGVVEPPRPPYIIPRVAPHCVNTLMIQHAAHKTRFYWAKISPRVGEHICSPRSMLGAVGVRLCGWCGGFFSLSLSRAHSSTIIIPRSLRLLSLRGSGAHGEDGVHRRERARGGPIFYTVVPSP